MIKNDIECYKMLSKCIEAHPMMFKQNKITMTALLYPAITFNSNMLPTLNRIKGNWFSNAYNPNQPASINICGWSIFSDLGSGMRYVFLVLCGRTRRSIGIICIRSCRLDWSGNVLKKASVFASARCLPSPLMHFCVIVVNVE